MPGLQWCRRCDRIYLAGFFRVPSLADIPDLCRHNHPIDKALFASGTLDDLRAALVTWASDERPRLAAHVEWRFQMARNHHAREASRQRRAAAIELRIVRANPDDERTAAAPDVAARAWAELRAQLASGDDEQQRRADRERQQLEPARVAAAEAELALVRIRRRAFEQQGRLLANPERA